MIRPLYPAGESRRKAKRAGLPGKPLPKAVRLQMLDNWVGEVRQRILKGSKSWPPEQVTRLIEILSCVIPEKAVSYVAKVNTAEIFSVDFPGLNASMLVVPDGFLSKAEKSRLERFIRQGVNPSKQVMTFSEFREWALPNIRAVASAGKHFLQGDSRRQKPI